MPKGENSGGRIPPDNRPTQAPGVGKNAKRHDLERRSTPFLHGSDLQQGDVQAMEQGQRIAPLRTQQPAAGAPAQGGQAQQGAPQGGQMQTPDPIQFIAQQQQARGLPQEQGQTSLPQRRVDVSGWTPIAARIANSPSASGSLRQAFLHQFSALSRRPYVPDVYVIDMNALDGAAEDMLHGR